MIGVELRKMLRRPRTWITVGLLCGLPALVAIFLKVTGVGPRPGEEPAFLAQVLNNGTLFPAAALAIVIPLFLPVSVAVVAGDAVAGEAAGGTLRYLLVRPVTRTRLLVAKLVAIIAFTMLSVVSVAVSAYALGVGLFGTSSLPTVSGEALSAREAAVRTVLAVLYVGFCMLGLGAIALFLSTCTDSPLGAALGALAALVSSQVMALLEAASAIRPYLPTRYWLSFVDLFRDPVLWRDLQRGVLLQSVYVVVFLAAAWANLSSKDITS